MDTFGDYDSFYNDGSASNDKAAAATVINHYSLLNVFQTNLLYSLDTELHALYLALDRVETAADYDERNFIIFYDSKSPLKANSGQDWKHPLVFKVLKRLN